MESTILGIIYIISNTTLECIKRAAVDAYPFIATREASSEARELYARIRKAYELEECFFALKEHQMRAQEGGNDILLLRKHILNQIHTLVE